MYKNMPKTNIYRRFLLFASFFELCKSQEHVRNRNLAFAKSGMNFLTFFHEYHMCSDLETIFWFDSMPKNTTIGIFISNSQCNLLQQKNCEWNSEQHKNKPKNIVCVSHFIDTFSETWAKNDHYLTKKLISIICYK